MPRACLLVWMVLDKRMHHLGGYLCAFDQHKKCCLDTPLAEPKPNAGTLVHTDYYYAKDPEAGRSGASTGCRT